MSADNYWLVHEDGTVEERRMSWANGEKGDIIHKAETQDEAYEWALARQKEMNENGEVIEYGIHLE